MRRIYEGISQGGAVCHSGHHLSDRGDLVPVVDSKDSSLVFLKNQRGSLIYTMFAVMLIITLSATCILIGLAFSARKNAVATYDWFGEAMDFAAMAANYDGNINMVALRESSACQYFQRSFAQMTNTVCSGTNFSPKGKSVYPSPIVLESFRAVSPGEAIPNGTARQPGYLAIIEVPVMGGDFPFIDNQEVRVKMKYFAVVKSSQFN